MWLAHRYTTRRTAWKHWYAMWWMTWRAHPLIRYDVDDVGSTCTLSVYPYPRAQDAGAGEVQKHLDQGQHMVKPGSSQDQARLKPGSSQDRANKLSEEV
jgi:hypothetical protein